VYLYSALFVVPHTQGSQEWITQCYLQLHQCKVTGLRSNVQIQLVSNTPIGDEQNPMHWIQHLFQPPYIGNLPAHGHQLADCPVTQAPQCDQMPILINDNVQYILYKLDPNTKHATNEHRIRQSFYWHEKSTGTTVVSTSSHLISPTAII